MNNLDNLQETRTTLLQDALCILVRLFIVHSFTILPGEQVRVTMKVGDEVLTMTSDQAAKHLYDLVNDRLKNPPDSLLPSFRSKFPDKLETEVGQSFHALLTHLDTISQRASLMQASTLLRNYTFITNVSALMDATKRWAAFTPGVTS